MMSSEAPSNAITVTRASLEPGTDTVGGGGSTRPDRGVPMPGPRSVSGTASESIIVIARMAAPVRVLRRPDQR
jgi:hypothetical protein